MIFVELTSSIRFAVVTSSLNGERVELSLANYKEISGKIQVENMMKKYKVFLKTSDTHSENQFSIHGRREKVCV